VSEFTFGEWLKRQRRAAGLTQEQLAQQVGCAAITLRKLESEERRPSEQIAARLAEIFRVPKNERDDFLKFARGQADSAPNDPASISPWKVTLPSTRVGLPPTITSLIGREKEIAEIRVYLQTPHTRLVTLIGPPGIGKTRLSLETARASLPDFPDGIAFVPLAPLDDPSLIPNAIVQALGYSESKNLPILQQLKEAIGQRRLLIVLDNCEHLIEEVAPLASDLLLTNPYLTLLTTSRESLRVPGEWLYPVPPLNLPQAGQPVDASAAAQFAALTLFAERARAVRPDFKIDDANVRAVASICIQLDGLPLAIELLASRMRLMSPQALLERMNDQVVLSADGMRAVSARQKTLNNAIGWTYNFLPADEQSLFARLSVFAGGFTLETVETVFSDLFDDKSVASLVTSLLDKSLLQRSLDRRGETRLGMLVTIQQFGLNRLRDMQLEEDARNRHLSHFLSLAETGEREIRGPCQMEWADRIQHEQNNIRAALEWAMSNGKVEAALQFASALFWFWDRSGSLIEGRVWMERALSVPRIEPAAIHAKALYGAAYLSRAQGDFFHAHEYIGQSIQEWSALGEKGMHGGAQAKIWLAALIRDEGDPAKARAIIEESVTFFREGGDQWSLAWSLMHLGMAIRDQEDYGLAWSTIQESVKFWRAQGDFWGLAEALHTLALVAYRQSDYKAAYSITEEALHIQLQLSDKQEIAYLTHNLGVFSLAQGNFERALQFFERDLALFSEIGDKSGIVLSLQYQGLLSRFKGDIRQAQNFYVQGLSLVNETGPKWVVSNYFLWLADLAASRGNMERVVRLCSAARSNLLANASYWDAFEQSQYDRLISLACESLGEQVFVQMQSEGASLPFDRAIAYALEEIL